MSHSNPSHDPSAPVARRAALRDAPPESLPGAPTLAALDAGAHAPGPAVQHPQQIGRYRIVSILGEGGMGVVYRAEQTHPVRRTVAIKLIKLGLDTRQVVARFDAERQALAVIDHPNVARVFDAGADDLGRPYFVMEFVAGVPITQHCDTKRLSTKSRLALFCQACAAIQHAHQKGIIHRDLKPGNLLVAEVDDQPVVKVIDFGLAKAMSEPLAARPVATEHGQLLGTPEYMSPEQASGGAIDTRTDVYALGVILYQLLTGMLPFESDSLRSGTHADVQRMIQQLEAPRPSLRLSGDISRITLAAHARDTEPQALLRTLRSDLDWVVMKAIEKDPERRYASVSELAADVQRYLRSEPVLAGPPTATYRLRKFVRRNAFAVAGASAVAIALILGAAGMTWQAIRATRAERVALDARTVAEQRRVAAEENAATVNAVNDFLSKMLASANPAQALGRDVTVKEVLDAAADRIREDLKDQPAVEAKLRFTIGRTYGSLGRHDDAMKQYQRALELATQQWGEESETALLALDGIGLILTGRGQFAEAEPILRREVELSRRALGPDDPRTLDALNSLAVCLHSQDRFADAEPVYREVIAGLRKRLGAEHEDVITIEGNLAFLVAQLGRMDEAEGLLRDSLEAHRKVLGADHPRTMVKQGNFALLLQSRGRLDQAIELYRDSLERSRRVNGAQHPSTYMTLANLGNSLRLKCDADSQPASDEALSTLQSALDGQTRTLGEAAPPTLETMHNLSLALRSVGKNDQALALARQALELVRAQVPAETTLSVRVHHRYAAALLHADQPAEAEAIARQVLPVAEKLLRPGSGTLRDLRLTLADSLDAQGNNDEASKLRAAAMPTTAPASSRSPAK